MNVEELNTERKKQKISIEELAKRAKLPKGTVEKVLFGIVKNPRIDTMQAIEHALGLDQQEIITSSAFPALTLEEREILALYSNLDHMGKKLVRQTLVTLNSSESVHIQKNKNS